MNGISIIIPVYNREQFIEKAIKSVLTQNYEGKLEIIISDDGSTDRTLDIAVTFGEKVTILKKPENCKFQGASAARNRGIKAATQPYICFLDSDDFFLPAHLQKMVAAIESKPNIGFAFCRTLEINEEISSDLFRQWTKSNITDKDISNPVVSGNFVVCTNVFIFQKEVFEKVGLFNETLKNGEDGDMWMRISEVYSGAFSNHFGGVRSKHGVNQLSKNNRKSVLECYILVFKDAIKRYHQLGLQNPYRLFRLNLLVLKYRMNYFKLFQDLYPFYLKLMNKQIANPGKWYKLSHFI